MFKKVEEHTFVGRGREVECFVVEGEWPESVLHVGSHVDVNQKE